MEDSQKSVANLTNILNFDWMVKPLKSCLSSKIVCNVLDHFDKFYNILFIYFFIFFCFKNIMT